MKFDRWLTGIIALMVISASISFVLFIREIGQEELLPETKPEYIVHNYVLLISRQDYESASQYIASQNNLSVQEVSQSFERMEMEIDHHSIKIGEPEISNGRATIPITVLRQFEGPFSNFDQYTETATLVQEEDGWKISEFPYPYWYWDWIGKYEMPKEDWEADQPEP